MKRISIIGSLTIDSNYCKGVTTRQGTPGITDLTLLFFLHFRI